jgi:putative oxidoreductase
MNESNRIEIATLLARLGLGTMFLAHGVMKIVVFTIPGTVQFFASVGLPGPLAYVTIFAEVVGGAMLLAGLYPRVTAAALLPILIGAAWVHAGNGWVFTAPNGGWEYPVFLVLMAVLVALLPEDRFAFTRSFVRTPRRSLAGA